VSVELQAAIAFSDSSYTTIIASEPLELAGSLWGRSSDISKRC